MTAVIVTLQGWGRLNYRVLIGCKWAVIVLVGVMTAVIGLQVFYRYVLNDALAWSEELARLMMVWMTFLGLPIAAYKLGHSALTLLLDALPETLRTLALALLYGLCLLVCIVAIDFAWDYALRGWRINASSLPIVKFWGYVSMPLGFALSASVYGELFARALFSVASRSVRDGLGSFAMLHEDRLAPGDL